MMDIERIFAVRPDRDDLALRDARQTLNEYQGTVAGLLGVSAVGERPSDALVAKATTMIQELAELQRALLKA